MIHLKLKQVREPAEGTNGTRLLVERLRPRGIRREKARLDGQLKAAAPSDRLRKWYGPNAAKWTEFRRPVSADLSIVGTTPDPRNRPSALVTPNNREVVASCFTS